MHDRALPHRRPRRRPRRPARAPRAHALPRRDPGLRLGLRHRTSPTCASWSRTGATATTGAPRRRALNALPAVPRRGRRARHPLHPRARRRAEAAAARDHARLAGLGRRVREDHRPAHRSGARTAAIPPTPSTSSCRRCRATASPTTRRARAWTPERIAALWAELMAGPRLRALRRAGRRLGRDGHARTSAARHADARRRHPPQHGDRVPARSGEPAPTA